MTESILEELGQGEDWVPGAPTPGNVTRLRWLGSAPACIWPTAIPTHIIGGTDDPLSYTEIGLRYVTSCKMTSGAEAERQDGDVDAPCR